MEAVGRRLLAPSRGSEQYIQWVSALEQQLTEVDAVIRLVYTACIEYLKIYNRALLLNLDCRTRDAFEYIERKLQEPHHPNNEPEAKETDIWLKKIYAG
jgi:hypothetical protein